MVGMQPTECDAVAAFKQQLGIHKAEDDDFGWIAEVGLQSPLPPRWTSHADHDSGYIFYVDHDRQVSSWENPLVPYLRRVVEIGRNYARNREVNVNYFEDQKGLLWHQHKHDLDAWHGPFSDDGGRQYYVNATEGISSWQDPRIDAQYIFELESGLLTSLEEVLNRPGTPDTPDFGPEDENPVVTADGAEVLTLKGPGREAAGRPKTGKPHLGNQLLSQAQMDAKEAHRSTLQLMTDTAVRLHDQQQDDLEAQRLQFSRKLQARRQRKKREQRQDEERGAHVSSGLPVRIPQHAAAAGPHRAAPPPLALDPESTDGCCDSGPQMPVDSVIPPPPPPPSAKPGEALRPVPPSQEPTQPYEGSELLFRPPTVQPSPLAGSMPRLPRDFERRLRLGCDQSFEGPSFGGLDLRAENAVAPVGG